MKALMLHHLSHENKDEAYELMKKGLTKNMTTHVCWHINGLIYRADKDYKEALKFYNQAHKRNEVSTFLPAISWSPRVVEGGMFKSWRLRPFWANLSFAGFGIDVGRQQHPSRPGAPPSPPPSTPTLHSLPT